ncbi:MAG: response regulator [Verrucomicrobiota bacterium]
MNTDVTPSESPPTASPAHPITVLLVDDQLFIGEVVRRMLLGQPDIAYHYCADGAEAVRRVQEIQPDVILQDLVMPGADGIELVRQYRAHERTRITPVILLSSSEDAATRARAAAAGVNEFMVKPPPKAALIGKIRSLSAKPGPPPGNG